MFKSLVPKDRMFFETFDGIGKNVHKAAHVLDRMLTRSGAESEDAHALKTLEHETDQVIHSLMSHLHRTFVTPIDREDIHTLACRLDPVRIRDRRAGFHHAYHHRSDHRSRRYHAPGGHPLGRGLPHCLGLDPDHPWLSPDIGTNLLRGFVSSPDQVTPASGPGPGEGPGGGHSI